LDGWIGSHHAAHPWRGDDPAFALQFVVGLHHRVAAHPQPLTEDAVPGQRVAGVEPAPLDLLLQGVRDLEIDRFPALRIEE
jgi:hypothetical protein